MLFFSLVVSGKTQIFSNTMLKIPFALLIALVHSYSFAQNKLNLSNTQFSDTLHYTDSVQQNHQQVSLCKKMLRGTLLTSCYNLSMGTYLLICPENISKWNKKEKFKLESIKSQYRESFTSSPLIDKDLWYINYIGHPYQGGFYYNTLRTQNVNFWTSSLYCIGQTLAWEYVWEAGMEQPSIQDLVTTPLGGILIGELSYKATLKMSKNGFRWYEVALVCLINPSYAINKGFKPKP